MPYIITYSEKLHKDQRARSASGRKDIVAADSGTISLTAAKSALYTIYVERIDVTIKTTAAQTITFQDTNGTPVWVEATDTNPGANTKYTWEFPGGRKLTLGKDFVAVLSGAGLACHIEWFGYQMTASA